jgi:hypothetical protein
MSDEIKRGLGWPGKLEHIHNRALAQTIKLVYVHINCNDPDTGNFAEEMSMLQILDTIELEGDVITPLPIELVNGYLVLGEDHKYVFYDRRRWVGNWCWDRFTMDHEDVVMLLEDLALVHGWQCIEAPPEVFGVFESEEGIQSAITRAIFNAGE